MRKERMTAEEALLELEPILFSIINGVQAVGAIQTAMAEGKNDMSDYPNALFYIWSHLTEETGAALKLIHTADNHREERERLIERLRQMPSFGEVIRQMEEGHGQFNFGRGVEEC